jgi:hypothetical protein
MLVREHWPSGKNSVLVKECPVLTISSKPTLFPVMEGIPASGISALYLATDVGRQCPGYNQSASPRGPSLEP